MAKVIINAKNSTPISYAAGGTSYSVLTIIEIASETTEARTQVPFSSIGTFSKLYVRVTANTVITDSTWRLRVNGANGNSSVSITALTTGEFQDNSNTDTISADDDVNYQIVIGAGGTSITVSVVSILFSASSNTLMKWGGIESTGGATFSTASTSFFSQINAASTALITTESNTQTEINSTGTWKRLFGYVSANARITTTTIRSRVNAGNGNQVLSITASSTGAFEDTSNTDTISANDLINYVVVTGTGTENLVLQHIHTEYLTTNNSFTVVFADNTSPNMGSSINVFMSLSGKNREESITESNISINANINGVASNLWINVSANTLNGNTPFTLRKNQGDTTLTVSVTASTTG